MSVTFDGPNKLIIADAGTTYLNVAVDIYSAWKIWAAQDENIKYEQAMRVVGGDPTVGGNRISGYFFLMNGWRIRPQEANHYLVVDGILLVDGGGDPFVNTLGTYNVRINQITPLQAEAILVETGVSGLTAEESNQLLSLGSVPSAPEIADAVWDEDLTTHTAANSAGEVLSDTRDIALRIQNIEEGNWKIVGTQMIFYNTIGVEMFRFNLLDENGNPSSRNVFERQKV